MDTEKLKDRIGNNISACRRQCNMTQAELAQKLNYSDKAVSKWERGESIPDVITLAQLAEFFGVGLDALVSDHTPNVISKPTKKSRRRVDRRVIQMLVSILVWFVALLVYVILSSAGISKSWLGFIYAIPANAIVLLSLRSAWRMFGKNMLLISIIVWGSLLSLYVSMLVFTGFNLWKLFLLGLVGQAAVLLWFRMFRPVKEETHG